MFLGLVIVAYACATVPKISGDQDIYVKHQYNINITFLYYI